MSHETKRILVFGADGLRPDLIDPDTMPNLAKLATTGTRFTDHHAAYPSHTRVNASTFSTGTTPGRHGIVANTMLVPGARPDHIIDTGNYEHLDAMAAHDTSGAQLVQSLSDVLTRNGQRLAVAGTGSTGSNALWTFNDRGRIVNPKSAFGIADLYDLRDKLGAIPEMTIPHTALNRYATHAVTDIFLHDPNARVITIWLTEPDTTLHVTGIGSPESREAMQNADECLGIILETMDQRGIRDQFDILFLSDHGHSTVRTHKSLREFLVDARTDVGGHLPELATASDFIYAKPGTPEPGAKQLAPLVEWLYDQPWVDVVLGGFEGSEEIEGVLPMAALWNDHINHRRPLLAVSPSWSNAENEFGVPGTVSALTTQVALKSSHGSLSPYDMHATFVANGPSFTEGTTTSLPTGATDIMPTILSILGLEIPDTVDGRVLHESLEDTDLEPSVPESFHLETAMPGKNRSIVLSKVDTTTYVHGSAQGEYRLAQPNEASLSRT